MILLTGATGYIGSHAWIELLNVGYEVLGIDNLCNSNSKVLDRLKKITGSKVNFFEGDVRDKNFITSVFKRYPIKLVIHFAALKAVGDSVHNPLDYYHNNLEGLLNLLRVMQENKCKKFIFSSSATVYDPDNSTPYIENMSLGPVNPYGWTKYMGEQILRDIEISDSQWSVAYLRYFNPVGAHESGLIGEYSVGVPNNLMPYISQVAIGQRDKLSVFGGDWPTPDGTGVRDYIHVVDLALGHLAAVDNLLNRQTSLTVNLGTGKGYSVLELIQAFEKVSGREIPYQIVNRRHGDIAVSYADTQLAKKLLNWSAQYNLERMCADTWRWQSKNPYGYGG